MGWSGEGCEEAVFNNGDGASATCKCTHLTAFALVLRTSQSTDPTCAARPQQFLLAFLYLLVIVISAAQIRRTGGGNTLPLCEDMLRLQHVSIVLVCALRVVVLLLGNALAERPGVTVLLFQIATFGVTAIFGVQGMQWGKIGLFAMDRTKQESFKKVCKVTIVIFLLVALAFPCLVLAAGDDREGAAGAARAGAYAMGGMTMLFALTLGFFGCSLVREIRSVAAVSKRAGTKEASSKYGRLGVLETRLSYATALFALCFFLQGLSYILVVQENALNDEISFSVLSVLFHLLDCSALLVLLFLFSWGIAARRATANARASKKSSAAAAEMATL